MPLYIGLLSGTSLDAIDAALVRCGDTSVDVLHTLSHPFPQDLQAALRELTTVSASTLEAIGGADAYLGDCLGQAALALLEASGTLPGEIRAIGSHGQTIRHRPDLATPFTWQIGDANRIAEITGITTVADFRRRDMAAQGQGAPLAPALHQAVFRDPSEDRAVLNIGGIANLTLLPADPTTSVTGFDTGPGNLLLDYWYQNHHGEAFDDNGRWAGGGNLCQPLLESLLSDRYFARPAPKTTGREYFNADWLETHLQGSAPPPAQDIQRTLSALTAQSIARALIRGMPSCRRLLVCGGGIHNKQLLAELQAELPQIAIESSAAYGIEPDWVEAAAFAWLAHRALAGLAGNVPTVTGARHPVILGAIHPGKLAK